MNKRKQKQLLAAARACAPAAPPPNFSAAVLVAMERTEARSARPPLSDQLSVLFPRVVVAAVAIAGMASAFEFYDGSDIALQLAHISEQWLLPLEWL
jgi:hypothetical protein